MFFSVLGVIASSVERLATEIRRLQRTEVREAEEFFSAGQRFFCDASAILSTENPTGLVRIVRRRLFLRSKMLLFGMSGISQFIG